MLNPFGSQQVPGSYKDLKKRVLQNVQNMKVDDQIFKIVQNAYEQALNTENVVLSRPERTRLFSQVLKSVLEEMVRKLDQKAKK